MSGPYPFKLWGYSVPIPPNDLLVALVFVVLFLPVVVIASKLLAPAFAGSKKKTSKRD
jgi:hypothetical protein